MNLSDYKLYRWWKGGLWVLVSGNGRWLQAKWTPNGGIYDEHCHSYHKSFVGIIEIEDYTK